jgi:hypothetical protein
VSEATEGFVSDLVRLFPELDDLLAEHRKANDGTLLPHLFMADVARWTVKSYCDETPHDDLRRLFAFLEDRFDRPSAALRAADDVRELLTDSFLEILPHGSERGAGISALLGPVMRAEMEARFETA